MMNIRRIRNLRILESNERVLDAVARDMGISREEVERAYNPRDGILVYKGMGFGE